MAELNVGTMEMVITADGSAAISELERVQDAAEGAAQSMDGLGGGAGDGLGGVGRGAEDAAKGLEDVGGAAGDADEGLEKAGKAAQSAGKSMKELGESLSKAGGAMTKFMTLPIVGLMTAGVKGASDLTETVGKTEVVFGQLSDRVMEWSERSVEAMGLARGTALEFASTYGDMATGMGLSIDKATEMSMSLTQLAADMASFKNISTELAAQKLNAVFTGETEGLKSMGIVMTQANLQAFALSRGITEQVSKLSQAEQVMLRYQYVMEATKNAQGDFVRTGDSLANQARKLGETVKQLGERFGAQLVPMVTPAVAKLQQLAQAFSELDGSAKNTVLAVAGVAAAVGPALLIGGKILTLIASLKAAMAALTLNPALLALAGIAAAVAGVVALKNALDDANKSAGDASEAYKRMQAALEKPAKADVQVELDTDGNAKATEAVTNLRTLTETPIVATVAADAQQSLDDAQKAVDALAGEKFGKVTVNGETTDIDADIEKLQKDLGSLKGEVEITANGEGVISADGTGIIDRIQERIGKLQAVIPLVADEDKRATLEAQLSALQAQMDALSAGKRIALDMDNEELEKLKKVQEADGRPVTVTLVLEGREKLDEAQKAVNALMAEGKTGVVTVDGDTVPIDGDIAQIREELGNLKGEVAITASGDGLVTPEGTDVIADIQGRLDALKVKVSIEADEAKRAKLEAQIGALQGALDGLAAGAEVKLDATGEGAKNAQAFADAVAELPEDKTYSATGEFIMPKSTEDAVKKYTDALAAAASATGDYKSAVEALNAVADSDAQEKMAAVQAEGAEAAQGLARQMNSGIITQAEYDEGIKTIVDDMTEQIRMIESARDAQKEANAIFADGSRENDYGAFGEGILQTVHGQGVTREDTDDALRRMNEASANGDDMSDVATQGQVALQGALAATVQQYEALAAAVAQYDADMAGANATQSAADAEYEAQTQRIDQMREAMETYSSLVADWGTSGEDALAAATEGMDPAIVADFTAAVTNADGSLMDYSQSIDAIKAAADEAAAAEQAHADALAAADAQRQSAAESMRAAVDAAEQAKGVLSDPAALKGMLDTVEKTGVQVTEAQREAIVGAQQLAGDMAEALASEDPAAALEDVIARLGDLGPRVEQAAKGIPQGLADGMGDTGAVSAAGEALGDAAVEGVNAGAGTHSPSTYTTQTGRDVARGLADGMGDTGAVSAAGSALGGAAVSAVQRAANAARSAASGAGNAIGRNLIEGATAGVRSAAARLASAAAQAVRSAVSAAKAAAEIHSPSRLMEREVGVQLPRGVVVGVEKETKKLLPRMQAATRRLVSGASAAVKNSAYPPATVQAEGVDYRAMGDAMRDAMGEVRFGFSVGDRELARATRTADSREQALRARQIHSGYGGR